MGWASISEILMVSVVIWLSVALLAISPSLLTQKPKNVGFSLGFVFVFLKIWGKYVSIVATRRARASPPTYALLRLEQAGALAQYIDLVTLPTGDGLGATGAL